MKLLNKTFLIFLVIGATLSFLANDSQLFASGNLLMQIDLKIPHRTSTGETLSGEFNIQRTTENAKDELTFNLSTNNSSLIQFKNTEVKLLAGQERGSFKFTAGDTSVKTSANINISLSRAGNSRVPEIARSETQKTLEVFPALIESVTAQPNSMIGTKGAKVNMIVELRGSAPSGGTRVYVGDLVVAGLDSRYTHSFPELRVPAGSSKLTFSIEYEKIWGSGSSGLARVADRPGWAEEFNLTRRTVDIYLSLNSLGSGAQTLVSGITHKAQIQVIPLEINYVSAEPTRITDSKQIKESLITVMLNAPPGPNETIEIAQSYTDGVSILWSPDTNCVNKKTTTTPFPLTQGVTNYKFKLCFSSVWGTYSPFVNFVIRGGGIRRLNFTIIRE